MATQKEHPALAAVRKSGAGKVKVACSDIDGILRGKYLHRDKFWARPRPQGRLRLLRRGVRLGRARRLLRQHQVTGWQHGFPDALARLDLDTARRVPWDNNVPFFLGEFVNADGTPTPCARARRSSACSSAPRSWASRHGRHGVRVVQLCRDAAELGRQEGRGARAAHAGHVRLFAAAHERPARASSTR
jgi:hypothetical protein